MGFKLNRKTSHETRVLLLALFGGLPGVAATFVFLFAGGYTARLQWTFAPLIIALWLGFCFAARERVVGPLRTMANLLEALRQGDYSIRGRVENPRDPLGEVMLQINAMAATLRD